MKPYSRILCPVDGSEPARRGASEAIRLASAFGCELRFIAIAELHPLLMKDAVFNKEVIEQVRKNARAALNDALSVSRAQGCSASAASIIDINGRVSPVIVKEAIRYDADLIVMGTHGLRGWRRIALGSDAEGVVRDAPCAVLLVRSPEHRAVEDSAVSSGETESDEPKA